MKSAEALDLRFSARAPALSRLLQIALATGLLAGCLSSWLNTTGLEHQLKLQQEQREETVFLLERKARPENAATSVHDKSATAIEQRLSVSWIDLLQALDKSATPGVSLLGFTPDADNKQIRLQVEAGSLPQVLQYIEKLQASAILDQVHLVHQQPASNINAVPAFTAATIPTDKLHFTISAQWVRP